MKTKLLLFLLFFGFAHFAQATDYGYVRVVVLEQNVQHRLPVTLFANGKTVGNGFSHADTGMPAFALTAQHLNAQGSTTPLKASYQNLKGTTCKFTFRIEFSFTANFQSIIGLGTYGAPDEAVNTTIPIGLNCGGEPNRVCSANPNIQRQITQSRNQKIVAEFDGWKRNQDAKLKARQARLQTPQTPPPVKNNADALAKSAISEESWEQPRAEPSIDQAANNQPEGLIDAIENSEHVVARNTREQLMSELLGTPIGAYPGAWVQYDMAVEDILNMAAKEHQMVLSLAQGAADQEKAYQNLQSDLVRDALWLQTNIVRGGLIKSAADLGLRAALGDSLDACELITRREYCNLKSGRKLGTQEVISAGLGLMIANRAMWSAVMERVGARGEAEVIRRAFGDLSQADIRRGFVRAEFAEVTNATAHAAVAETAPYKAGSIVKYFKLNEPEDFVRVHTGRPAGVWIVKKESVSGLTAIQIREKLSLPSLPTHISDVHLPAGASIRSGKVASNFGGGAGATQYEIIGGANPNWFTPGRIIGSIEK